jgi:uncharacterized protein YcbK (DUF882 family)
MLADILELFEAVRSELKAPLAITSGRRTQAGQDALREKGYRAATHSPHVWGAAIDVVVPAWMNDTALSEMFLTKANQRGQMLPRIGMHTYRRAFGLKSAPFIHVDVMPAFIQALKDGAEMPKHMPDLPDPMPAAWRIEALVF